MGRWLLVAVLLSGCKREDVVVCEGSTTRWRQVQEALVAGGLRAPLDENDVSAEQRRCVDAMDQLKTGPKQCIVNCYAKAPDRDALLDCDRACSAPVQAR